MFLNNSFRNNINLANSLDSDQARHFVGPDLVPSCLQKYQQTTPAGRELICYLDYADITTVVIVSFEVNTISPLRL